MDLPNTTAMSFAECVNASPAPSGNFTTEHKPEHAIKYWADALGPSSTRPFLRGELIMEKLVKIKDFNKIRHSIDALQAKGTDTFVVSLKTRAACDKFADLLPQIIIDNVTFKADVGGDDVFQFTRNHIRILIRDAPLDMSHEKILEHLRTLGDVIGDSITWELYRKHKHVKTGTRIAHMRNSLPADGLPKYITIDKNEIRLWHSGQKKDTTNNGNQAPSAIGPHATKTALPFQTTVPTGFQPQVTTGLEPPVTTSFQPPVPTSFQPPVPTGLQPQTSFHPPVPTGLQPQVPTSFQSQVQTISHQPPVQTSFQPPVPTDNQSPVQTNSEPPVLTEKQLTVLTCTQQPVLDNHTISQPPLPNVSPLRPGGQGTNTPASTSLSGRQNQAMDMNLSVSSYEASTPKQLSTKHGNNPRQKTLQTQNRFWGLGNLLDPDAENEWPTLDMSLVTIDENKKRKQKSKKTKKKSSDRQTKLELVRNRASDDAQDEVDGKVPKRLAELSARIVATFITSRQRLPSSQPTSDLIEEVLSPPPSAEPHIELFSSVDKMFPLNRETESPWHEGLQHDELSQAILVAAADLTLDYPTLITTQQNVKRPKINIGNAIRDGMNANEQMTPGDYDPSKSLFSTRNPKRTLTPEPQSSKRIDDKITPERIEEIREDTNYFPDGEFF